MKDLSDVGRTNPTFPVTNCYKELDTNKSEELAIWRNMVNRSLKTLGERITLLELHNHFKEAAGVCESSSGGEVKVEDSVLPAITRSLTFVNEERSEISAFIQQIKSRPFVRLQFIWLIVCFLVFVWYGVTNFIRAEQNEKNEFKPKKLRYVKDFKDESSSEQYKMPIIYFTFTVSLLDNMNMSGEMDLSEARINETLIEILESQNYFEGRVLTTYFRQNYAVSHEVHNVEEVSVHWEETLVFKDFFIGRIELKLADPPADSGQWMIFIHFTKDSDEVAELSDYTFSINRQFSALDGVRIPNEYDGLGLFEVSFTEVVYHTLEDSKTISIGKRKHSGSLSVFESIVNEFEWNEAYIEELWEVRNITFFHDLLHTTGFIIKLTPNLVVEHWEEYIEYDFWDWVAAMGGMLSLLSLIFFSVAYTIATRFDQLSLGILPYMSMIFDNYEKINLINQKGTKCWRSMSTARIHEVQSFMSTLAKIDNIDQRIDRVLG